METIMSDWAVGSTFEQVIADNLPRTQIVQYAGASGDYNPAHTDELFATSVLGYPTVFAHGMLTMGMTGRHLTDLFGVENIRYFGGRFTAQVWPGETLRSVITVEATERDDRGPTVEVAIRVINQDDKVVFTGSAVAAVP